jgi:hypothetical protein
MDMGKASRMAALLLTLALASALFLPCALFAASAPPSQPYVRVLYFKGSGEEAEKLGEAVREGAIPGHPVIVAEGTGPGQSDYLKPSGYHAVLPDPVPASAKETAVCVVYEPDVSYTLEFRKEGSMEEIIEPQVHALSDSGSLLRPGDIVKAEGVEIPGFTLIGEKVRSLAIDADPSRNIAVFAYRGGESYAYTVECRLDSREGSLLASIDERRASPEDLGRGPSHGGIVEEAPEIYGYTPLEKRQDVIFGADGQPPRAIFVYERDPSLWDILEFDSQNAAEGIQAFAKLSEMSVEEYNSFAEGMAYPPALPIDPSLSGWQFSGWHCGVLEDSAPYSPALVSEGGKFYARYEKKAAVRFAVDPGGTGTGALNGKSGDVVVVKTSVRYSPENESAAPLDLADIPEASPGPHSKFAGWKGSNVSGGVWGASFKDGDANYARFDMLIGANPPTTSDSSGLWAYAEGGAAAAAGGAIVLLRMRKVRR